LMNPRKPTFKVTAKDETLSTSRISELGGPFYVIFAILFFGVLMTIWRVVTQPYSADITLVVGGWNILNLLMVGCALGVVSERRNPQSSHRVTIARRCDFLYGGETIPATIEDVSIGGARIRMLAEAAESLERGTPSSIRFQPLSDIGADVLPLAVRNFAPDGNTMLVGCRFMPAGAVHFRLIADLIFANSEQWKTFQESRRVNIGIFRGIAWFCMLSFYQTGRGMGYLLRRIGAMRHAAGEPVASKKP
jgi:cellulose synthase (UDP-forming)